MNKKTAWLNSIGAIESDREEFQWYAPAAAMYYSEEYIKNTPLEKIQAGYERHIRFMTNKRKPAISILKELDSQGFDEYDIAHILDESKRLLIESYLNDNTTVERILYSEISNYLFSLDELKRGTFATNTEKLLNYIYIDSTNCSGDARKLIVKIYDHSQLVMHQINNATNILANGIESAKKNLKEEVQKDIKGIEKEYITILGIFAAIVLAFVGGITFSSSVLQNMASVSIYRLVMVIDFLGFILVNTIYLLMKFVFVINNHDTEVFKIETINYILAAIAVLDVIVYFVMKYT